MAIRIELEKDYAKRAINKEIASLKRSLTAAINPMIKEITEKDIAAYTTALNTITDTK